MVIGSENNQDEEGEESCIAKTSRDGSNQSTDSIEVYYFLKKQQSVL